jgi:hypothetical protein
MTMNWGRFFEPSAGVAATADPLLRQEVLCGVDTGNTKPAICGRFLSWKEPFSGLEPETPSLP